MTQFRNIPSIDLLLGRPAFVKASADRGREVVRAAARVATAELRERMLTGAAGALTTDDAIDWLEARTLVLAKRLAAPSLRRVINATGVVIHTNLGRAPLASAAASAAAEIASGYSNLEYDLETGERGHRHVHAERLLANLTGAEAAIVVNNAAAAALLSLAALASGREVIVSRGELVEIGGGFRVPEVLAQSGALLREVGTTNRTRVSDYAAAIGDRTAAILRVHPSNFTIQGFAERPVVSELVTLASRFKVPLIEDLGSGWLGVMPPPSAIDGEPSVRESVAAGVDVVVFSGDKLLGGPQAGILVGRRDVVDRLRTHPLMRALRVGKLTYAALEATLGLWAGEPVRLQLPIVSMLRPSEVEIEQRAQAILAGLGHSGQLECSIIDGVSTVGGGSAPGTEIPTRLIAIADSRRSATDVTRTLRSLDPAIVTRIQQDCVVIDLRTVLPDEDAAVLDGLRILAARIT